MISYLVTVKNGEEFITPLLDNFCKQINVDSIEVIFVDDGSTDKTSEYILDYGETEFDVKLIKTDGVGRSKALNMALEEASKEYVAIMDVDDLAHPLKTDIQAKIISESQVDFLFTNYKVFFDKDFPEEEHIQINGVKVERVFGDRLFIRNPFFHSSMVVKKITLDKLGGYNENLNKLVDYELYLRAHSEGYSFSVVSCNLTYKRFHDKQSFERNSRKAYILAIFKMQVKWIVKSKKYQYLIFPPIKYLYSLLPHKYRSILTNSVN